MTDSPQAPSWFGPLDTAELDRSLRRLARELVNDCAVADDVVQEAWLAALERNGESIDNPRGWMRRVVRNMASRFFERSARRQEIESFKAEATPIEAHFEPTDRDERSLKETLIEIVRELREPYRTILRMRYLENRSLDLIAVELGRPRNTVKSQMRRGTLEMRESLDRRWGGDRRRWIATMIPFALKGGRVAPAVSVGALAGTVALLSLGVVGAVWWFSEPDSASDSSSASSVEIARAESPLLDTPELVDSAPRTAVPTEVDLQPVEASSPSVAAVDATHELEITCVREDGSVAPMTEVLIQGQVGIDELPGGIRSLTTDARGRATAQIRSDERVIAGELDGVTPGVILLAREAGGAWSERYLVPLADRTRSIELIVGGPGQTLVGRIIDAAGDPVPGVRVVLQRPAAGTHRQVGDVIVSARSRATTSDEDGRFRFESAPAGIHEVTLRARGWQARDVFFDGEGEQLESTFELEPGARLTGIVRGIDGRPVEGAIVWQAVMGNRARKLAPEALTDAMGRFELSGLPSGVIRLFAALEGDFAERVIDVDLEHAQDIQLDLAKVEPIRLRLLEPDGEPAPDVVAMLLSLHEEDSATWMGIVESDAEGRVVFEYPPGGQLALQVRRKHQRTRPALMLRDLPRDTEEQTLELKADPSRTATIKGSLVDAEGHALGRVTIVGCSGAERFAIRASRRHGTFRMKNLKPDVYRFVALVEGKGVVEFGTFELSGGETADFGLVHAPEPVTHRFEPDPDGAVRILGSLLDCKEGGEPIAVVPPTTESLDLFPGEYVLRAEDSSVASETLLVGSTTPSKKH